MPWWLIIVAAVAMMALQLVFMPRKKGPKPEAATDMENPTAEAGRPWPVVFGTITVKGLNCVWFGEKRSKNKKVKA